MTSTRAARSTSSPAIFDGCTTRPGNRAFERSLVQILPYDTATPEQNLKMHQINAWIRRQAEADPTLGFVDTRSAVAAPGKPDTLSATGDHLHPSPAGYRAMAEAIRPVIEQILR